MTENWRKENRAHTVYTSREEAELIRRAGFETRLGKSEIFRRGGLELAKKLMDEHEQL